jgi:hypothetical protein
MPGLSSSSRCNSWVNSECGPAMALPVQLEISAVRMPAGLQSVRDILLSIVAFYFLEKNSFLTASY